MDSTLRSVTKVVQGQKTMEGVGVRVCRTLGGPHLKNLDPFLLLDELRLPDKEEAAGFPSHPHRGFNTCKLEFVKGVIGPGGVQWMTAGRGIVHSEMPKKSETGRCWGFQLWINLAKKDKMMKPRYQDYQAIEIPEYEQRGVRVRVLGGTSNNIKGPIKPPIPVLLLDVIMQPGSLFEHAFPPGWNAMAYVSDGKGELGGKAVQAEQAVVFGKGYGISTKAIYDSPMRFLLIAGDPIDEPIVQHGPFVMNTEEEIVQAFQDYQRGTLQHPDDDVWND